MIRKYSSILYDCGKTNELIISSSHGDIGSLMKEEPDFVLAKQHIKSLKNKDLGWILLIENEIRNLTVGINKCHNDYMEGGSENLLTLAVMEEFAIKRLNDILKMAKELPNWKARIVRNLSVDGEPMTLEELKLACRYKDLDGDNTGFSAALDELIESEDIIEKNNKYFLNPARYD